MKKKRYSPEQIIRKLREAEALKAQGFSRSFHPDASLMLASKAG